MKSTIYLIRHGQTDWNEAGRLQGRTDVSLNDVGRLQAKCCGRLFAGRSFDLAVCSPLSRARETATIIGQHITAQRVLELELLAERDVGMAAGLTSLEVQERFLGHPIPGWESDAALQDRAKKALDTLGQKGCNEVLVVTHGAMINAVLALISGGALGTRKTRLDNASITTLRHLDGAWKIDQINGVGHLPESGIREFPMEM